MTKSDAEQSASTPTPLHELPAPPAGGALAFGMTLVSVGVALVVEHVAQWAAFPAFSAVLGGLTMLVALQRRHEWLQARLVFLERPTPPAHGFVMVPGSVNAGGSGQTETRRPG